MGLRRIVRRIPLVLALVALVAAASPTAAPARAQALQAPARIALVHAAPLPGDSLVTATVEIGGVDTRVGALRFGSFLNYRDAPAGARVVKLFAGDLAQAQVAAATPLLTASMALEAGKDFTLAAVGGANGFPLEILALSDAVTLPVGASAKLRVVHAAPFAPGAGATAVDIVTESGQAVPPLLNLSFKDASVYTGLPSGVTFDLKAVPSGQPGAPPVIDLPPLTFRPGQVLTLFAIGGANGYPPTILGVELAPRKPTRLRVIHAAPGADGANPLNLLLNGARRWTNIDFSTVSDVIELDEGPYTLSVEQPGEPPGVLASVDALLRRDREYIALIRPGADGQGVMITVEAEPGVSQLPGDFPLPPGYGWLQIYHLAPFDTGDRGRLDVRNSRGELLDAQLGALRFGEKRILALPAREYDLRFTSVGGARLLADVAPFTLTAGGVATIFAVGNLDGGPSGSILVAAPVQVRLYLPVMGR